MRKKRCENGFSIIELLIALAISAMLLVAVAVAFSASMMSYRQNEDIFKAVNSARQALFRIKTQLRTATAVDPNSPANECSFITAGGDNITYRFNSGDGKLYLITNDDLTDSDYVLCDNVAAVTFSRTTCTRTEDEVTYTYVARVDMSMTVVVGDAQRMVSSAAVIRRNLYMY